MLSHKKNARKRKTKVTASNSTASVTEELPQDNAHTDATSDVEIIKKVLEERPCPRPCAIRAASAGVKSVTALVIESDSPVVTVKAECGSTPSESSTGGQKSMRFQKTIQDNEVPSSESDSDYNDAETVRQEVLAFDSQFVD